MSLSNSKGTIYVFYATLLYGEYAYTPAMGDLPDGALLYYPYVKGSKPKWFNRDLTPVLPEDVPKALQTLVLLMGIGQ